MDLEDEYEGENYEEYNTAIDRTLSKKMLEEDKVINLSPETQKRKKTSVDMVPSIQYPQKKSIPLAQSKTPFLK